MKYLIIKSYNDGTTLAKKRLPKAMGRSVSYQCEDTPAGNVYLVVRDYNTGEALYRFRQEGSSWAGQSIEFSVVESWPNDTI